MPDNQPVNRREQMQLAIALTLKQGANSRDDILADRIMITVFATLDKFLEGQALQPTVRDAIKEFFC